jgi:hypothetical protein
VKTIAPIQIANLAKSFAIFFVVASLAWFAASYVVFRYVAMGWPVFIGNLLIAGVVGWWWYRTRYHTMFSYDQESLEIRRGKRGPGKRKWRDFSRVSLVHEGYARFMVRLYGENGESLDIPVSDLKLNPSDFRFEAMDLVKGRPRVEESKVRAVESQ